MTRIMTSKLIPSASILDNPLYVVFRTHRTMYVNNNIIKVPYSMPMMASVHVTKYDAVHNARILGGTWRAIKWSVDEDKIWEIVVNTR